MTNSHPENKSARAQSTRNNSNCSGQGCAISFLPRLVNQLARITSSATQIVAALAMLALIVVILTEVVARYVFHAPTLWAFDLSWMLNGSVFMLGAAFTLRVRQHVAIDVFSNMLPVRFRDGILAAILLLLFIPAAGIITWAAWGQTWNAYLTTEKLSVSAWGAVIWPFRLCLSIGLSALMLEALNQALQALLSAAGCAQIPDETKHV